MIFLEKVNSFYCFCLFIVDIFLFNIPIFKNRALLKWVIDFRFRHFVSQGLTNECFSLSIILFEITIHYFQFYNIFIKPYNQTMINLTCLLVNRCAQNFYITMRGEKLEWQF